MAVTEHKTMNTIIHAALRRDLQRFDDALVAFPPRSRRRADELATAWDNFAHQLNHHHQDEEAIFWPALSSLGVDQTMAADLEREHARMLEALDVANRAVDAIRANPSAENADDTQS
jgi:hemerythrin-like domain-containing protein